MICNYYINVRWTVKDIGILVYQHLFQPIIKKPQDNSFNMFKHQISNFCNFTHFLILENPLIICHTTKLILHFQFAHFFLFVLISVFYYHVNNKKTISQCFSESPCATSLCNQSMCFYNDTGTSICLSTLDVQCIGKC